MIIWKILGAVLVVCSCGGFGFSMAYQYRNEISALQQLLCALEFMRNELEYRLTPLPQLCRKTAEQVKGGLKAFFLRAAEEMESQISPNVQMCFLAAQHKSGDIPKHSRDALHTLGQTLGTFDLNGQLRGLDSVYNLCNNKLGELERDRPQRVRNYQTLGLCAGAALAILLM